MLTLVVALLVATPPWDELKRLYAYDVRAPLELREAAVEDREGVKVHDLSFASPKGERINAFLVVPTGSGPFPAILYMHGVSADGKGGRNAYLGEALRLAKAGFAGLTIDGPFSGARAREGERLFDGSKPERSRQSLVQTVVELRRAVDVLRARPEVDGQRLGFVGSSYGAVTGGLLAGVEPRIKAYVLCSGLASLVEAQIPNAQAVFKVLTRDQVEILFDPVAPVHYVGHAAPSALFFQNGRRDDGITADSAHRWHQAGSQPKLIKWYDGGHGLNPSAAVDRAEWLKEQLGVFPRDESVLDALEGATAGAGG